jgi:alkylated DNA repair dioxygenase AlkB
MDKKLFLHTKAVRFDAPVQLIRNAFEDTEEFSFLNDLDLFSVLNQEIQWEQKQIKMYGKTINIPRLTAWYGDKNYTYSGIENKSKPFTETLLKIKSFLEEWYHEGSLNSCLANLYRNGKDSVDWHSDDEKELGDKPLIYSFSFGAERTFSVRDKITKEIKYEFPLRNNDLVIMEEDFQEKYQHAILKEPKVKQPRINLTFRTFYDKKD